HQPNRLLPHLRGVLLCLSHAPISQELDPPANPGRFGTPDGDFVGEEPVRGLLWGGRFRLAGGGAVYKVYERTVDGRPHLRLLQAVEGRAPHPMGFTAAPSVPGK